MIKRIDIKNYQSLHNVSLEMGKFTVIFGDSDVGKSAVYRAVRGLVTAEDGDTFITEGKPKTGVSLVTSTSEVVWVKPRGKSSTYHLFVDGKKVKDWSRARNLPGELAKRLKFEQMVVDGDKFYPNFRGQFDPLFMLFESAGKRARLLGSLVSNLLLRGIKTANLERNRVEADVRAMVGLADALEKKLEINWETLEKKAISTGKFACMAEEQVVLLVQVEELSLERGVVVDGVELEKDFLIQAPRTLYELDVQISGTKIYEEVQALIKERSRCIKALEFEHAVPDEEDFDKVMRMEQMWSFIMTQTSRLTFLRRDLELAVFETKRKKNEITALDKEIKKLELDRYVKCPHCHKEFKL